MYKQVVPEWSLSNHQMVLEAPTILVNQITPSRTPRKMPRGELADRERIDRFLLCLLWL